MAKTTEKQRRRTRGAGSIVQVRNNDGTPKRATNPEGKRVFVWTIRASYTDAEGNRRRAARNVCGTRKDAVKKLEQLTRELSTGVRIDKQASLYFGAYAREWHELRAEKGELAATSIRRESETIETICAYWENKKLSSIDPRSIERLYVRIRKDKTAQFGHYSNSSLSKVHVCLNQIFNDAVNNDLISKNPCASVKKPKPEKSNRGTLTPAQVRKLIEKLDEAEAQERENPNFRTGHGIKKIDRVACLCSVRLALATSMRLGEICALRWGEVSLAKSGCGFSGVVRVRASLDRYGNRKKPKTAAGVRNVTIDQDTAAKLAAWKKAQANNFFALGLKQTAETPVFATNLGDYMRVNQLAKWWEGFRVWAGFPELRFHELRHTSATMLLANGVDIKTVQKRGGWASPQILLDVYAHSLEESDQRAANVLGGILGGSESDEQAATEEVKKVRILTA